MSHNTPLQFVGHIYNPSVVAPLWGLLWFSATQMVLLKNEEKQTRDNLGRLRTKGVRSLDLKLLSLLIIHDIIIQVVLYNTLWDFKSVLLWDAEKEQIQKKKKKSNLLVFLWINPQEYDGDKSGRKRPPQLTGCYTEDGSLERLPRGFSLKPQHKWTLRGLNAFSLRCDQWVSSHSEGLRTLFQPDS